MALMNPLGIKDTAPRHSDTPSSDSSASSTGAPAAANITAYPMGYPGMQQYSYPMPLINTPGAPPAFNKRDVTPFLRLFDTMCENYNIPPHMRVKRLTQYCTSGRAREIESFPYYLAYDWEGLVAEIKEEWKKLNTEETMISRPFLHE